MQAVMSSHPPYSPNTKEKPSITSSFKLSALKEDRSAFANGLSTSPSDVSADISGATLLDQTLGGHAAPQIRSMSLFHHGGLGNFLYRSHWGTQVYIAFLILVVVGCEAGLVVLNRFLFMTGTWRFPYPVAMSFAQVLATHVLLLVSASLTKLLKGPLSWLGLEGLVAPSLSFRKSSGLPKPDYRFLGLVFPLAAVFLLKVLFSTISIAYAILPKYSLFRVYIIPSSLAMAWGMLGTTYSISTLASALSAVYYLRMASIQPTPAVDHLTKVLAYVSTPCVAFYPVLFVWTFTRAQDKAAAHDDGNPTLVTTSPTPQRSSSEVHWRVLYNTSFLSTIMMTIVLLLSGDIPHIWRNCYILDQYKLWVPTIGSFLTSFGVFVATPLLIRATSPLTATFLIVPRSAFQLALLHSNMPLRAWAGVIGCYLCSIWYLFARRAERGSSYE